MRYFAYGSNMSLPRLRQRVPEAAPLGVYSLARHELRFHKRGADGSAKCDAFETGVETHSVLGVLFEIPDAARAELDRVEGLGWGYLDKRVTLAGAGGEVVEAFTYYAVRLDDSLKPYSWYLNHVLTGARDAQLPADYIACIERIACMEDADPARDALERAVYRAVAGRGA